MKNKFNAFSIWREVVSRKKRSMMLLILMVVITSFLDAFSISLLLPIIQTVIGGESGGVISDFLLAPFEAYDKSEVLVFMIIIFFLLIVLKNILTYITDRFQFNLFEGMRGHWMKELMTHYLYAKYDFFENHKQGDLVNNVLVETDKAFFCLKFVIQFISSAILSALMLVVLLLTSWVVTLALTSVMLLLTLSSNVLIKKYATKVGQKKIKHARYLSNTVSESIFAIKQIKAMGMENGVLDEYNNVITKYVKVLSDFRVFSSLPKKLSEVVIIFILAVVMIYAILILNIDINNLVPVIAIFVLVGNRVAVQVSMLVNSRMHVLSNYESLRRINKLVREGCEQENLTAGYEFNNLDGDIIFQDLLFSYKDKSTVLDSLNFIIPKGKFVFLIGDSGSGKSTIIDLLLRFRDPNLGRILINDNDLLEYSAISWRKCVGYVGQDVMLFNTSILENVRFGSLDASDDDVVSVCKKVHAHEFIQKFSEGYNTNVGDRGMKLSGGQKQRLALARAMLRNPQLIIFDEATSALDQELEEKIIQEIKSESVGKTVLFITHRLSTSKHADLVYQLKDGKVLKVS